MLTADRAGLCEQYFSSYKAHAESTLLIGTLGAALGIATAPAVLPQVEGVPLWSWFAGVAGVGAFGAGAVMWSQSHECTFGACDSSPDASLGQLIMLHGPPLLAIPLTYGIRALLSSDGVQARPAIERDGAHVLISGHL
jgi:hypothetical protein